MDFQPHPPKAGRTAVAMVTDPNSVARFLTSIGEQAAVPERAPSRGPPYWASTVLRQKAMGEARNNDGKRCASASKASGRARTTSGEGHVGGSSQSTSKPAAQADGNGHEAQAGKRDDEDEAAEHGPRSCGRVLSREKSRRQRACQGEAQAHRPQVASTGYLSWNATIAHLSSRSQLVGSQNARASALRSERDIP